MRAFLVLNIVWSAVFLYLHSIIHNSQFYSKKEQKLAYYGETFKMFMSFLSLVLPPNANDSEDNINSELNAANRSSRSYLSLPQSTILSPKRTRRGIMVKLPDCLRLRWMKMVDGIGFSIIITFKTHSFLVSEWLIRRV